MKKAFETPELSVILVWNDIITSSTEDWEGEIVEG